MENFTFTRQEKAAMVRRVQMYFTEELEQSIGSFDAEFLIDFFAGEMGAFFYNRGLYDAEAVISEKLSDLGDLVLQLEKPVSS